MKSMHRLSFGAELQAGGVRFRLWAPSRAQVHVELFMESGQASARRVPMRAIGDGWHEQRVEGAAAGTRYRFDVGDGLRVPDPASRCNPHGVHGPSEVVDPGAHRWSDGAWTGLPWHTAVVYELHVGTFTSEGTLRAAALRLPYLRSLGITAVELMPLAAFSGARGWGYDGVLPFALHRDYGRPDDLKRFVDQAHALGVMVILDVVYNHFGPDGNYLHAYCPEFYAPQHRTPWGAAINFDGAHSDGVRRFFIDNALYWVGEYHVDGLRLDAVHAIHDDSPRHIVEDIADALRSGPGRQREVHLILENDGNTARWLGVGADGRPRVATAQWNDDLHHAAHVWATGETHGYYGDYADQPLALFAQALAEGFVYQGQASPHRANAPRGEPSRHLPSRAFVSFLQNHDQVGNRARGERLERLAPPDRIELLLTCLLLAPQVPMLFMGEEFAATSPFLYFCDFDGDLAAAVTQGRRAEFAGFPGFRHAADGASDGAPEVPDPNALATFVESRLSWFDSETPLGSRRLALVKRLTALRRAHLEPLLSLQRGGGSARHGADWFAVDWPMGPEARWSMRVNVGTAPRRFDTVDGELDVLGPTPVVARPAGAPLRLAPGKVQVVVWHRPAC